jgi:FKBP-type peptidyl-prolyl cis-trans isomerase FkpA
MLRTLLFVLCISVVAISCLKDAQKTCAYPTVRVSAPKAEQDSIQAFLDADSIDAVKHDAGFYYKVINPGTGTDTMTLCSEVLIEHSGKLATGEVINPAVREYLVLGGAPIEGWVLGIPLIKKGGEIRLFIPPALAYGYNNVSNPNGVPVIPAGSMVIYDIKLIDYSRGF